MALAVALVILIVITLLGVTAVRRAQLQARLSQNAEATVMARGTAAVNARTIKQNVGNFNTVAGDGYSECWIAADTKVLASNTGFTCASPAATSPLGLFATALPAEEKQYSYFMVKRETPSTLPTNAFRSANLSGVAYQFASFSTVSGYDASDSANGIAEVGESLLLPDAKVPGVTVQ